MNKKYSGIPLYLVEGFTFILFVFWLLIFDTYQMFSLSLLTIDLENAFLALTYSAPIFISYISFHLYECSNDRGKTVLILLWLSLFCAVPFNLLCDYKAFQFVTGNPVLGPAVGCGIAFLCDLIRNPKLRVSAYIFLCVFAIYALSQIRTECTVSCAALIPLMYRFRGQKIKSIILSEFALVISVFLYLIVSHQFSWNLILMVATDTAIKETVPAMVAIPVLLCIPVNKQKKIPDLWKAIACPVLLTIVWLTRNL